MREIITMVIMLAMLPLVITLIAVYLLWVWKIFSTIYQWLNDRKYKRLCKRRDQLLDQQRQVTDGKRFADLDLAVHRIEREMKDLL